MKTALLVLGLSLLSLSLVAAQTRETVLYSFGAYPEDGTSPNGGLTLDPAGNIYGVTGSGGKYCVDKGGCGTVYELSLSQGGTWTETILYNFCTTGNPSTCPDGSGPIGGLLMDPSGNFYGSTFAGGTGHQGGVYRLSPPSKQGGSWAETVLWNFATNDKNNGWFPGFGKLNMDAAGNLYGTTVQGGKKNLGIVYQLKPDGNGTYSFSILHSFSGPDGALPQYGVARDQAGNLYGTTQLGGKSSPNCPGQIGGCGLVYKLTQSNGTWTESILYKFNGVTGAHPFTPISFDQQGNLYGTFMVGGGGSCFAGGCGGIFKLIPSLGQKEMFYFNSGPGEGSPLGGVLVAKDGSVFGAASDGGQHPGDVFRVKGKTETVLYSFCSLPVCADGRTPLYGTLIERMGTLCGTTLVGGDNNFGVVYSLTKGN